MNVSFDGIELATLGVSVLQHNARQMAPWAAETVDLLGSPRMADVGGDYGTTQTELECSLSADTDNWVNYTHDQWLARLRLVKRVISPRRGYRKLVLADATDLYRWCLYTDMSLTERRPWQQLPFHPMTISFRNLEPFWRKPASQMTFTSNFGENSDPIINNGDEDTRPNIRVQIGAHIEAYRGAAVQPVNLFTIDDLQINWAGTGNNALESGDILEIDAESLTVVLTPSGIGQARDAIASYDYSGPGAFTGNGFPVIKSDGSMINYIHPNVSAVVVDYDELYL